MNFGVLYGMGGESVAEAFGISKKDGQQYLDLYYSVYRGIRRWQLETQDIAKKFRYSETPWGRRRVFEAGLEEHAMLREAINSPIQGQASDFTLLSSVFIDNMLRRESLISKLIFEVHDSIGLDVHPDEKGLVVRIVYGVMTRVKDLARVVGLPYEWITLPVEAEMKLGNSWGTTTPVEVGSLVG